MNTDSAFPRDAATATEVLAALGVKDQDEVICRYPTCHNPRKPETPGVGRPSAYCDNPEHTAVSNHRARNALKQLASGVLPEMTGKREQPAGVVPVESLRSSVLHAMTQLQTGLERYVSTLVEIADPDISAAHIQSIIDQANARLADAQQTVSAKRSLRLAAESASIAARQEAQAERDAAETAIEQMEEAQAKTQRIQEEAEQQIATVQAKRDETIERVQREAQQQIEEAFQQGDRRWLKQELR